MYNNIQIGAKDPPYSNMQNNIQIKQRDPILQPAFSVTIEKFEHLGTPITTRNGYQVLSVLNPNAPEFVPFKQNEQETHEIKSEKTENQPVEKNVDHSKNNASKVLHSIPEQNSKENKSENERGKVHEFSEESLLQDLSDQSIKVGANHIKADDVQSRRTRTRTDMRHVLRLQKPKDIGVKKVLKPALLSDDLGNSSSSSKTSNKTEAKIYKRTETTPKKVKKSLSQTSIKVETKTYKLTETISNKVKKSISIKRTLSNNGFRSICANILRPMRSCEPKPKTLARKDVKPKYNTDNQKQKTMFPILRDISKSSGTSQEISYSPNSKEISKKISKFPNSVSN